MDPLLKKDGLVILGNDWPASGPLVGSMDLTLELTLCAVYKSRHKGREGLKSSACRMLMSTMHDGHWLGCIQN